MYTCKCTSQSTLSSRSLQYTCVNANREEKGENKIRVHKEKGKEETRELKGGGGRWLRRITLVKNIRAVNYVQSKGRVSSSRARSKVHVGHVVFEVFVGYVEHEVYVGHVEHEEHVGHVEHEEYVEHVVREVRVGQTRQDRVEEGVQERCLNK